MWHVWEKNWFIQVFLWGNLKERDHLEDLGVDGGVNIRVYLKKRMGVCELD